MHESRAVADLVVRLTAELADSGAEQARLLGIIDRAAGELLRIDLTALGLISTLLAGANKRPAARVIDQAGARFNAAMKILAEAEPRDLEAQGDAH